MHASAVARQLGISRVVIPRAPGILCALGLLDTDVRADYVQTVIGPLLELDLREVNGFLRDLDRRAQDWLTFEASGMGERTTKLSADLRYAGQNHELTVSAPPAPWSSDSLGDLCDSFHRAHQRAYGYRAEEATVSLVNLRVTALVERTRLQPRPETNGSSDSSTASEVREVWWGDGFVSTPVYQRSELPAESTLQGPAIVEQMDSTIAIAPDDRAEVDAYGNVALLLGG